MESPESFNRTSAKMFRSCLEQEYITGNISRCSNASVEITNIDFGEDIVQEDAVSFDPRMAVAYILFVGSSVSLLSLVVALLIFHYFKNIRCDRIIIHIHFMVALALKCMVFILISEPAIFGLTTPWYQWEWYCKLITSWQMYASVASVNWMFVQGHYLNSRLTTNVFAKRQSIRMYVFFGWGISSLTILIWGIAMEIRFRVSCWQGHSDSLLMWLLFVPILAVLLVNLTFLINIIRVLLTKIQLTSQDTEGKLIFRAMKATVVLFPLLGLNILLLFFNPGGPAFPYYMLINASIHSSQGLFVALFYCFICHDVHEAIRREYRRLVYPRSVSLQRTRSITTSNIVILRKNSYHRGYGRRKKRGSNRKGLGVKFVPANDQVVFEQDTDNDASSSVNRPNIV